MPKKQNKTKKRRRKKCCAPAVMCDSQEWQSVCSVRWASDRLLPKNVFCVDSPTLIRKLWAFSNRISIKAAICNRRFTWHMSLFQWLAQRAVNQLCIPCCNPLVSQLKRSLSSELSKPDIQTLQIKDNFTWELLPYQLSQISQRARKC